MQGCSCSPFVTETTMLKRYFRKFCPDVLYGESYPKNIYKIHRNWSLKANFFSFFSEQQTQPPEVFCKKAVFKSFKKFTGKQLCESLFFWKSWRLEPCNLIKKRLWLKCFPVNFVKSLFFRTTPVAAYEAVIFKK